MAVGAQPFNSPFVFPTGRTCRSFDELALACQKDWKTACKLLEDGYLESFLSGLGRVDLAMVAKEAAAFPDRDRGLDQLLGKLPGQVLEPAKLCVEPGQLNVGTLKVGQDSKFELRLSNQSRRLLYGTISCSECPWLSLGDPATGTRKKMFQFLSDNTFAVNVCGKSLRAGNKPQEGRIVIDSNGGSFTVIVTIDVPVQPFPEGVLAGALTPRKIAEQAKQHPKDAAGLFHKGAVVKWYAVNGWTYPVTEPSASGVAAVQQFFEALGLTKPPKVGINVADIRLAGRGGEIVCSSVQVVSQEKRPVYAHAVSDQPWLKVNDVALEGRMATVNLRVPEVPNCPGETLRAALTITANGRQKFVVPVSLTVTAGGPGAPHWASAGLPASAAFDAPQYKAIASTASSAAAFNAPAPPPHLSPVPPLNKAIAPTTIDDDDDRRWREPPVWVDLAPPVLLGLLVLVMLLLRRVAKPMDLPRCRFWFLRRSFAQHTTRFRSPP